MQHKILFFFASLSVCLCFFAIIFKYQSGKKRTSHAADEQTLILFDHSDFKKPSAKYITANPNILESLREAENAASGINFQKGGRDYVIPAAVLEAAQHSQNRNASVSDTVLADTTKSVLPHFFDNEAPSILAKKITDAMTPEELLSQVFMFGWAGQSPNAKVADWVNGGLGSIKIFGWNTADTQQLAYAIKMLQTKALQSRFGIPLFVATDQEGGRVRHVKGVTSEVPSALDCGASGIPHDAYLSGYFIGQELAAIGINVNFAPTVDIYSNYDSTIIASRSFGDNPNKLARLACSFSNGLQAAGVLSTAKHFPGHGDTSLDSHGRLPKIPISKETFMEREMVPFHALIKSAVPFVMSGHLNFPQFMAAGEPATFSHRMLTELLRNELHFDGLVVTDDMMMVSALNYAGSFSHAVQLALEAGNNIIESSTTPSKSQTVWTENIHRMKTDKNFYGIVRESAEKIIYKKLQYFKNNSCIPILPDPKTIYAKFPIPNSHEFFQSFAARAVSLIKQSETEKNFAPLPHDKRFLFLSDYTHSQRIMKNFFPNAQVATLDESFLHAAAFDKIVFCIYDNSSAEKFKALQKQFPYKKYAVLSVMSPVFLRGIKAETILAAYSYSEFSFTALCASLRGDFVPRGILPLEHLAL